MGFLDKLFGKKEEPKMELAAPLAGEAVSISQVNDPTFSDEILGKGLAIRPTGNEVFAPCDGKIEMMFDTGHAVSMTSNDGIEILIHVGLETVNLKGKYYQVHAANGDQVKKGDLLMDVDLDKITGAGLNTVTPVLICNTDDYEKISLKKEGEVSLDEAVLSIS